MATTLTISCDSVTCAFFRPTDDDTFEEYFAPDGPERPVSFFMAHHSRQVACEDLQAPPETGDSVVIDGEELVVRFRLFTEAKEEGGRRSVAILATPPFGATEAAANAS